MLEYCHIQFEDLGAGRDWQQQDDDEGQERNRKVVTAHVGVGWTRESIEGGKIQLGSTERRQRALRTDRRGGLQSIVSAAWGFGTPQRVCGLHLPPPRLFPCVYF